MKYIIEYDNTTGKILQNTFVHEDAVSEITDLFTNPFFVGDAFYDDVYYYIVDGLPTLRPRHQITWDQTVCAGDNTASCTATNIVNPSTAEIYDWSNYTGIVDYSAISGEHTVTDGNLVFKSNTDSEWHLIIKSFPYLDYKITLTTLDDAVYDADLHPGVVQCFTDMLSPTIISDDSIVIDSASVSMNTHDVNVIENIHVDLLSVTVTPQTVTIDETTLSNETISVDLMTVSTTSDFIGIDEAITIDTASVTATTYDIAEYIQVDLMTVGTTVEDALASETIRISAASVAIETYGVIV